MITFKDRRTNEIKTAFSLKEIGEKVIVCFVENGKEYSYNKNNIEITKSPEKGGLPFLVYALDKECYSCHKITEVLTYITYDDDTNEDVIYPWDQNRLLKNQNVIAHMMDESIEYYGLKVVGDDPDYDAMLMTVFPSRVKNKYSQTQKRTYPMNVCNHCGSGQGWNYIYREVNMKIKNMEEIALRKDG